MTGRIVPIPPGASDPYHRAYRSVSHEGPGRGQGNWTEITSNGGYYQGAVYDGTIQMEINQAGDRMKGKWLGFGRDPGEINDGPWTFTKVSADYGKEPRQQWDIPPPAAT